MAMLYDKLSNYNKKDYYPFHMPGHKRRMGSLLPASELDITEIEGFDNLHHPEGILKDLQERTARLFGAEESFLMVNGSTGGILSAISSCTETGGHLLMCRNSHKAAYHGVLLNQLKSSYLYPTQEVLYGINGGISPKGVEEILERNSDIQAVFLTSPTYDGVVSDVETIAEIVHRKGIPLIVDEAHGAHFGFHPCFPESAVKKGADVVIQSLHKTLPSLTQTAVLHVNGDLVDREKLRLYLQIFQSSSPSYLLMGAMDACIDLLEKKKESLFDIFAERIKGFRRKAESLTQIQIPGRGLRGRADIFDYDESKILISLGAGSTKGGEMAAVLRGEYHLEMELAAGNYCLGMTTIADEGEGFDRLLDALKKLDKRFFREQEGNLYELHKADAKYILSKATNRKKRAVSMEDSTGEISGEFVYLYPPGIPLLVPGEYIGEQIKELMLNYRRMGMSIQGLKDYSNREIQVLI